LNELKITIDVGENIKAIIETALINNATRKGVSLGEEIQKAFKIDFTAIAVHIGTHAQTMKAGCNVTIESKTS
jgi:hypothetical protein